ncbi:MAG TPA: aspartate aminotransferase family protein [Candidatus Limnocylindria bacterium]|nr:aspartate aminotransferase family protein [Candidatus Limnocylindria bacterium]
MALDAPDAVTTPGAAATDEPRGPRMVVPYPGPRARALIARLHAVEGSGPRTGPPNQPLMVERAHGATLVDPDGNAFIDLAGSFAAATVGHGHPEVAAAITDQLARASHVASSSGSAPRVDFQEALLGIAPPGLDRVLLGMSGSDANDIAVRLARSLTGRRGLLAFSGGYLGRSGAVVGLNGRVAMRERVGRDADAHFLPYPFPYRWPLSRTDDVAADSIALVRHAIEDPASGVGRPAAVIVEPIQGNAGVVVPPPGFLERLRELCDQNEVVLIFDEIQAGFGRTGRVWSGEHWGVVPDLMTVGKGIGGGMAVSAVVGRAAFMSHWPAGTHTSTFLGNAVNLAAGSATIRIFVRDRLWERSAALGQALLPRIVAGTSELGHVGEVRGIGLFAAIEIVADRVTRTPDPARARAIRQRALAEGVVVATGGPSDAVLKLAPPLTIAEDELDAAVDRLLSAIGEEAA